MSIVEPFHRIRHIEPARFNVVDPTMPDREDHERHIADVARANGGRGFPVCPTNPQSKES